MTEPPSLTGRDAACMIVEGDRTYCIDPLQDKLHVIGKRWTLLVIGVLGNHPGVRFNDAKRMIPGITARALSEALKALCEQGLVERRVDAAASPPRVEYALSRAGFALRRALIPLIEWAEQAAAPLRLERAPR